MTLAAKHLSLSPWQNATFGPGNMLTKVASAAEGLELERKLFEAEGTQIAFWTSQSPGLVCPRAYESRPGLDQALVSSAARGWPVDLRPTGGGTVPQGPSIDNVVVTFNAAQGATINSVYRDFTDALRRGLGPKAQSLEPGDTPGSFCDGSWNLSLGGQKIVGTAQRWRPQRGKTPRVIAHAVILTRQGFEPGAAAVASFHADLGLPPVHAGVHISLEETLGLTELPEKALENALKTVF